MIERAFNFRNVSGRSRIHRSWHSEELPKARPRSSNPAMKREKRLLHRNFEPWMIEAAKAHLAEGWSYGSFPGKHFVPIRAWEIWSKEIPELIELREEYCKRKIEDARFWK